MKIEDLATQAKDRDDEERLRLEEEEADREIERKTKHGAESIRTAGSVAL